VVFHLSDLLFWAEYYRTAQDIGLLTIAVGQRRPVWISQTCTVQRQHLSQTSRGFGLKTGIHHANLTLALCGFELKTGIHHANSALALCGFELKTGIHHANSALALVLNWRPAYTMRIQFRTLFLLQRLTSSRQGKPEKEFLIQRKANSRMTKNRSFYRQIIIWLSCD